MLQNTNPFNAIIEQNEEIKTLLQTLISQNNRVDVDRATLVNDQIHYMTITEIFKKKLISKPTLYKHIRAGLITMYKLGGRSYVDKREFEKAFEKVSISQ